MSRDAELAAAAGFYNGEGGMYSANSLTIKISQSNCRYEPAGTPSALERTARALGVGKVLGPRPIRGKATRTYWEWIAHSREAVTAFELMRPWLSLAKLAQGEAAIAAWNSRERKHRWGSEIEFPCGHPRTPENSTPIKGCRECHRQLGRLRYQRHKADVGEDALRAEWRLKKARTRARQRPVAEPT